MIFIRNKLLPFGSYKAFAFFPILFYKGEHPSDILINHEIIHFAQQKELYFIGFYLLYLYFWVRYGYVNNPFEREASENQHAEKYMDVRKRFGWREYKKVA